MTHRLELEEQSAPPPQIGSKIEPQAWSAAGGHAPDWFLRARLVLLLALLGGPLAFGAVQTWAWCAVILAVLVALLVWAFGCAEARAIRLVWSPLYVPLSLFQLLALYQYLSRHTLDRVETRECLLKLAAAAVVFFLGMQLSETLTESQWHSLPILVSTYSLGVALLAIMQFFSGTDTIYWLVKAPPGNVAFGPYVNHNHYAGLMEMLIPISVGFLFSRPKPAGLNCLVGLAVVVPVASVLLSGSRGGMCSLLVEVLAFGVLLGGRDSGRYRIALLGSLVLALLMFFWMDPGNVAKRLETVFHKSNWAEPDLGSRLTVSLDTLQILRDYPWLGAGLGSFETVYTRFRSFPSDLDWDHAHDDYAEALAETGIIGGVLILSGIVLFLAVTFRRARKQSRDVAEWVRLGAAIGCSGLLFHSFMDFNFHIPANALWFVVCAALAHKSKSTSSHLTGTRSFCEILGGDN